jgi:hypothetical protein
MNVGFRSALRGRLSGAQPQLTSTRSTVTSPFGVMVKCWVM